MCEHCFNEQIESFQSSKEWEKFDLILSQKLGRGDLTYVKQVTLNYGGMGYAVYHCSHCSQNWCLSDPDHAWRGFFLIEEKAHNFLRSLNKRDRYMKWGVWALILTAILLTLMLYLN